jgi:hypothetical protein
MPGRQRIPGLRAPDKCGPRCWLRLVKPPSADGRLGGSSSRAAEDFHHVTARSSSANRASSSAMRFSSRRIVLVSRSRRGVHRFLPPSLTCRLRAVLPPGSTRARSGRLVLVSPTERYAAAKASPGIGIIKGCKDPSLLEGPQVGQWPGASAR